MEGGARAPNLTLMGRLKAISKWLIQKADVLRESARSNSLSNTLLKFFPLILVAFFLVICLVW